MNHGDRKDRGVGSVRPAVAALAVALGVLAAVSGCATKGTSYATSSPAATAPTSAASPLPTASMTPLPAAAGQLTGTQLAAVLLPASFYPAGFAVSSGPVTSGASLTSATAKYKLGKISCASFQHAFGGTGFGETAMAAATISGTGQVYDELVYQFRTASEASAFVSAVGALAARCGKFTATDNGASGTFAMTATTGKPVGGHRSMDLLQTGTLNKAKLVIDTLFSASGVDVFAAAAVGIGAGVPVVPAREVVIYNLMKRQAAAAVLG